MVTENLKHVQRIAGYLASDSSAFKSDAGLLDTYIDDLSEDSKTKYSEKTQNAFAGLSEHLSNIAAFLTAPVPWAHDKKPPVTVPDVVGLTEDAAKAVLDTTVFTKIKSYPKGGGVQGKVARQYPPTGTEVARSDELQLFVYTGE